MTWKHTAHMHTNESKEGRDRKRQQYKKMGFTDVCLHPERRNIFQCCHCIAIWPINILRFHSFNGSFDFSRKKVHLWLSSAKEKTHPVCTSIFYVKASLRLGAGQYTHCVKGAYLCECLHTQKKNVSSHVCKEAGIQKNGCCCCLQLLVESTNIVKALFCSHRITYNVDMYTCKHKRAE